MAQNVDSQITLIPGNLIVGTNLAAEYIRVTYTLTTGATSAELKFEPVARFAETPAVVGTPQFTPAGGGGTKIVKWYVSAQSATSVTITVELTEAAAGDKITMAAVLIGPQAWR